ncbi:MAG: D-2-hydroxyacid dehydrogenase, partial [Dehalococcoidales bacterium]|nr:D-2-hydroxyacid dehydrogenase [Dehalococcoidales bacterium]
MDSLNILVITPSFDKQLPHAEAEILRRIRSVSPRISVKDASTLVFAEFQGDESGKAQLDALLAVTEVIFGFIPPKNITTRAPKLKWMQAVSAGVDRHQGTEIWRSDVIMTGVSGIHATPIGEYVLGFMLMLVKNTPLGFKMKQTRSWQRYMVRTLRGKTAGIIGLGHIGREVARLAKAFGMRVIATRRSVKKAGRARYVDLLLPRDRLKELLKASDYVALTLPLTPETRHIIGEAELKAMKPSAYIINIGRGGLIDQEALIKALDAKQIAGAGLDVVTPEPLPGESRLWDFENVILSPHVSGGMEDYMLHATELFCDNLKRYLEG